MPEQYYIPNIEDFRVGYEYEMDAGTGWTNQTFPNPWYNDQSMNGFETLKRSLSACRVPYLSAEQIEAEGFVMDQRKREDRIQFTNYTSMSNDTKKMIEFFYYKAERMIRIYKGKGGYNDSGPDMERLFEGTCRCINDFRLICKLLNIK